jgi:hypothetical protein
MYREAKQKLELTKKASTITYTNIVTAEGIWSNIICMSKEKGVYTGIIEKDENGNYFCGEYLLDYQHTEKNFKVGDEVTLKSVIENPSDKSYNQYPKKSKNFFLANQKNSSHATK